MAFDPNQPRDEDGKWSGGGGLKPTFGQFRMKAYNAQKAHAAMPAGMRSVGKTAVPRQARVVHREDAALRKLSVPQLRDRYKLGHKVSDTRGVGKDQLVSQLLRDQHGNRRVNRAMGWSKIQKQKSAASRVPINPFTNRRDPYWEPLPRI